MMCKKIKTKAALFLIVLVVSMVFSNQTFLPAICNKSKLVVDVFTQKAPFDGRGFNQSSDPFSPLEKVYLYTQVVYNDEPRSNVRVTYLIFHSNKNKTLYLIQTRESNESGIATFFFRIPSDGFGKWTVNVTANIGGDISAYDILRFEVTWLVTISKVDILDENFNPKSLFPKGSVIRIALELENKALSPKNVTIIISALDSTDKQILTIVYTTTILHGKKLIILNGTIPFEASLNNASLTVEIYDRMPNLGGTLYCPPVSKVFTIGIIDLAITYVSIDKNILTIGENITVTIKVRNNGVFAESSELYILLNNTKLGNQSITNIPSNEEKTITVTFNISNFKEGKYVVEALIPKLPGEENIQNNKYVDGTITLIASKPYTWNLFYILLIIVILAVFSLVLLKLIKRKGNAKNKHEHLAALIFLK